MTHVDQVELTIPGIRDDASAIDLENVLIGISGVAGVDLNATAQTVIVEYDPSYVDPIILKNSVRGSGYPVTEPGAER
jgi:copper chaperone CopZ